MYRRCIHLAKRLCLLKDCTLSGHNNNDNEMTFVGHNYSLFVSLVASLHLQDILVPRVSHPLGWGDERSCL